MPNLNSPKPASLSAWPRGSVPPQRTSARTVKRLIIHHHRIQPVRRSEFLEATIAQNAFSPNQHSARSGAASRVKESFGQEGPNSPRKASRICGLVLEKATSILEQLLAEETGVHVVEGKVAELVARACPVPERSPIVY